MNTMPCWKDISDDTNKMKPATKRTIKTTKGITSMNENQNKKSTLT